jgi:hypothetical protein
MFGLMLTADFGALSHPDLVCAQPRNKSNVSQIQRSGSPPNHGQTHVELKAPIAPYPPGGGWDIPGHSGTFAAIGNVIFGNEFKPPHVAVPESTAFALIRRHTYNGTFEFRQDSN